MVIITALLGWALRRPSGPFRFQASVPSPGIESWQWYHTRFKGQRPVGVASVLDKMMSCRLKNGEAFYLSRPQSSLQPNVTSPRLEKNQ